MKNLMLVIDNKPVLAVRIMISSFRKSSLQSGNPEPTTHQFQLPYYMLHTHPSKNGFTLIELLTAIAPSLVAPIPAVGNARCRKQGKIG